jgi:hypothetical protein
MRWPDTFSEKEQNLSVRHQHSVPLYYSFYLRTVQLHRSLLLLEMELLLGVRSDGQKTGSKTSSQQSLSIDHRLYVARS